MSTGQSAETFVSHSANFEDIYLNRVFAHRSAGFYVDVGAAHPLFENDTKMLYDRGWHGVNIEPNSEFFDTLASERPRDLNLQLAVSDRQGTLTFYQVSGTGLSTADAEQAARARVKGFQVIEHEIATDTLTHILAKINPPSIDLLKVDVEGFELKVLQSNDWSRFRPCLILAEATYPETPIRRPDEITPYLQQQGYRQVFFDGLNDYYVENSFELPENAFDRPVNIFDRFIPLAQAHALRACSFLERHVNLLNDELNLSKSQVRSLEQQATLLCDRAHNLAKQLHELRHLTDAQSTDLARATAEIAAMRTRSSAFAEQLDQALLRVVRLEAVLQRGAHSAELELLRHSREEISALLQSTSWRITSPLRALKRSVSTVGMWLGRK